ncbi:MAG: hypothetical protein AAGF94_04685 [Pseudomonadota bacterium]
MEKLYFHSSTINEGKSSALLQADYNFRHRAMATGGSAGGRSPLLVLSETKGCFAGKPGLAAGPSGR